MAEPDKTSGTDWALTLLRQFLRINPHGVWFLTTDDVHYLPIQRWRWTRAIQDQPTPTAAELEVFTQQLQHLVVTMQTRSRQRRVSFQGVVRAACRAIREGSCYTDGGRISTNAYGYPWRTTVVRATRQPDGHIRVQIVRTGTGELSAWASWWRALDASLTAAKFSH